MVWTDCTFVSEDSHIDVHCIHENTAIPQTTKIGSFEFK